MRRILLFTCYVFVNFAFSQNEKVNDSISKPLQEVKISGSKKMFSFKNGNLKVEVANSILNAIPNTIDLLAKLPKIQISPDKETISMVGKGNPLLYIDNQRVTINDINSLSVDDIKSIEIINNPSSKYEAEGRAVILIVRKLSKKEGFKVDVSQVASQKRKYNNFLGINTSIKKNKLELKANFNYNQLNVWEKHTINYQIPEATIISNYDVEAYTKRPQFIFGGGLFYKINDDDYVSFNVNSRLQKDFFDINTETFNKQNTTENKIITASDNKDNRNFFNSFFNYSKKIKSINTQWFSGIQVSSFSKNLNTIVRNNFNTTGFELSQNRNQKFDVSVFSGRTDLEKVFKNEMKFEIGGLFLAANAKTNFNVLDFKNSISTTSNYNLKEQNSSGYAQLSGKIKKVDYSIGLRGENTAIFGKFDNEINPLIKKNFTNFFPKTQIDIPIDSSKTITINYSKSIVRPNYSATNQGATYINPYFIYGTNINLEPTINDEIAANFQYKDKSIRLSYHKNTNPVFGDFTYNNLQNILTFTQKNFKKETGFDLTFTLPFTYKFWTMNNDFSFILNKIEDNSANQNKSKPYFYYYSNNIFKLPKKYDLSVTTWGLTTQKEGVFERKQANFILDFAISKTYFKHWDCTLSLNDVFKNTIYREDFTINKVSSKAKYLSDIHEISLAVKYSFGKIAASQFQEKRINENENRIR